MSNTSTTCLLPNGKTIFTGRNWSSKWSRNEWLVKDGMAHPVKRHHFWCSVRGKVEDISLEDPRRITSEICRYTGKHLYSEVEGHGTAFSILTA
jgi:hypothetical protein